MMADPVALFVPGHATRHREKARDLDVALIVDLEDVVPAGEKAAARRGAAALVAELPGRCQVRINPLAGPRSFGVAVGTADLRAVVAPGLVSVLLPKVETPDQLLAIDGALAEAEQLAGLAPGSVGLGAVIETALGLMNLAALTACALQRPVSLSFGAGDLTTDLGIEWGADESVFDTARALVPIASRAAGLERPRDTVFADIRDLAGLRRSALRGKALGYGSKPAIHPAQIGVIRAAFRPGERQLAWAHRVVDTATEHASAGSGAFLLDGQMIDAPIVARARELIAAATAPPEGDRP